jgi:DNA polymerase (family 10)
MAEPVEAKNAISNDDIAAVVERTAALLEFKDENPFKVRSYRLAAEFLREINHPIAGLARSGNLSAVQSIPGVGKAIGNQIIEIARTGTSSYLEALRREIPETVLEVMSLRGVGIKTAQLLYRDFGVKSLDDLRAFVEGGGLGSVQGMGEKMSLRIRKQLSEI